MTTDWWAEVSYRAAHARIQGLFGKATEHLCVACGGPANEWSYDGADESALLTLVLVKGVRYPVTYSRFPEFYMPMCFGCHRAKDRGTWSFGRKFCSRNHELTDSNVYGRPGSNDRECRICRRDDARQRRRDERARLKALGLTARGTVPKRKVLRLTSPMSMVLTCPTKVDTRPLD